MFCTRGFLKFADIIHQYLQSENVRDFQPFMNLQENLNFQKVATWNIARHLDCLRLLSVNFFLVFPAFPVDLRILKVVKSEIEASDSCFSYTNHHMWKHRHISMVKVKVPRGNISRFTFCWVLTLPWDSLLYQR